MAAPKNNQFALGNGGGRPSIYHSPEELLQNCEAYFKACEEDKTRPTITGLALYLGFADKSTLYDYRSRPGLSFPIKRSLLKIESRYEEMLGGNNVTGPIFALKNFGWKDKSEMELTGKDGADLFTKMTEEELQAILAAIENKDNSAK